MGTRLSSTSYLHEADGSAASGYLNEVEVA